MRYYFELVRPDGRGVPGAAGVDLPGMDAARSQALAALRAIAREELDPAWGGSFVMLVRDAPDGEVLCTASVAPYDG